MKVIILTSSKFGTAAHHLPYLLESGVCEELTVVYNEGTGSRPSAKKKLKKMLKIGLGGALNGIRMRRWFTTDMEQFKRIENIEELCAAHGIKFLKTPSISSDTTRKIFREAAADVAVSLGNGYIPKSVFEIPRYGMINLHHEILPDYQNAQSIIWQLYNKSAHTGFTIHKIDRKIDTGEILLKEEVPIHFMGDLKTTIARTSVDLLEASARGLVRVLGDFNSFFTNASPQGKGRVYTTPSLRQFLRISRNFRELKKKK